MTHLCIPELRVSSATTGEPESSKKNSYLIIGGPLHFLMMPRRQFLLTPSGIDKTDRSDLFCNSC
jgi:hypothetical protein